MLVNPANYFAFTPHFLTYSRKIERNAQLFVAFLHYNNHDGVIHACVLIACISSKYSKSISAIKRMLSTTDMKIHVVFHVFVYFSLLRCMKV